MREGSLMLNLSPTTRIYLHVPPTDMRKSFNGLTGLVRSVFRADPREGNWFLFLNRRRDRIKILYWDRDGMVLWYKQLSSGTFEQLRSSGDGATLELDATQLALLLSGVTIESARRRPRFAAAG
jgi:transposase